MDRQARVKAPPGTFLHDGCITSCREPCASWELVHRAVGGYTSAICPQNHHHIIPDYSRPRSARYRIHICPLGVPFVWPLGGLCRQPRSPEPSPGGGLFCRYPPGTSTRYVGRGCGARGIESRSCARLVGQFTAVLGQLCRKWHIFCARCRSFVKILDLHRPRRLSILQNTKDHS